MKFFLDENLPLSTTDMIQELGFEVEHVKTVGLRGATDKEIAKYAKEKEAVLLTKDIEFGNFLLYPKGSHFGLMVLRLPNNYSGEQIKEKLKHFLINYDEKELPGSIIILQLSKVRIRKY